MIIKKNLIKREIAGDTILVPVGTSVVESNGLYVLNELGSFIWDILPEVESIDDIIKEVLNEYDIDEVTARCDITDFLTRIKQLGII